MIRIIIIIILISKNDQVVWFVAVRSHQLVQPGIPGTLYQLAA
jgi:hypothetical protein